MKLAPLAILAALLVGCGVPHHHNAPPAKRTDDGPAIERQAPGITDNGPAVERV